MPPWAAPVCDRVGYSLVSTAVRARWPDSMAARIPAPPAPTITTSYLWNCMVGGLRASVRGHVRVEREDHHRADGQDQDHGRVQQDLQPEPRAVLAGVVVDDGAQP